MFIRIILGAEKYYSLFRKTKLRRGTEKLLQTVFKQKILILGLCAKRKIFFEKKSYKFLGVQSSWLSVEWRIEIISQKFGTLFAL